MLAQFQGDSFADARRSKQAQLEYIYVIIDGFASKDENGDTKGLLFDLMLEFESFVSEKYGIKIQARKSLIPNSNFKKFLESTGASSGGVFGLSTTTINEERKKFLRFSPAYLNNISVLVSHNSIPTLSTMGNMSTDFKGLSAYAAPGTTYGKRVESVKSKFYPQLKVNFVPAEYDIVQNVLSDKRSFGFVDIGTYLDCMNQRQPIKRHPVGDKAGEQFGIIMPPGSDWAPVLSEFLSSGFLKSPTYRQLVIENVGKGGLRMID